MAKTYQDVIDEARVLSQDTDVDGFRNPDSVYLSKLNRALQELGRLRPEAFWNTFVETDIVVPEVTDADMAVAFPVPMIFYTPVVAYITGSIELIEDEFSNDGRAVALLTSFKSTVIAL